MIVIVLQLVVFLSLSATLTTAQQQITFYSSFYSSRELVDAVDLYLANYFPVTGSTSTSTSTERANDGSGGNRSDSDSDTTSTPSTETSTPPTALEILLQTYGPIEQWKVERIRDFGNLFNANRNSAASTVQLDLSQWDTSNADSMLDMFLKATQIDFDVSQWDTSKVVRFNGMFDGCTNFQGIGLQNWDVKSGRYFQNMFRNTPNLKTDLSQWNVYNAIHLDNMFANSNYGFITTTTDGPTAPTAPADTMCSWAYRKLYPGVTTTNMFMGSNCPATTDPDINQRANMPISFCVQDCSAAYQQHYDRARPNILLLMTDQQRYDTIRYVQDQMSRYDSTLKINTPYLDTLLQSGAYFETAYTQWCVLTTITTTTTSLLPAGLFSSRSTLTTFFTHNNLFLYKIYYYY
jgi:hypothetical protein